MDLTKIENPAFLKQCSLAELKELSSEIRKFLIQNVARTGGHLSSNLGVVELTIALHTVFDSPRDKIFFDVGHQCYTHKILTGRAKNFSSLRQYGGISGFQKRSESIHDVWEAGHSSTSLSAALAMAVSRDLNKESYHIVPVIGDGALGGGMSLEALNQIGSLQKKMIIIFNDNNMSISQNVGALTYAFANLRSSRIYTATKNDVKKVLNRNNAGKVAFEMMNAVKETVKKNVVESSIFGEFNLEYLGPVNGHDIQALIRTLEAAKSKDRPVVVHVMTKKGKGYKPCEEDKEGIWHGVGPFDPESGRMLSTLPRGHLSWSAVMSETLVDLARENENICAITPAMVQGSKLEKFFATYPNRSFDCGIAEEHAATFAAGLALEGKRPFLSVYSSFLQRAYDQINHDIARMDLPVVIGIDRAGLVGEDGDTHHGVFDISMLRSLPNLILAQPKDAKEAQNLLYTAFLQKHPFTLRYPRGSIFYNALAEYEEVKIGSWTAFNETETNKCIVISYGCDVDRILSKVITNKMDVCVINARFFKPLDEVMLDQLTHRNLPIIIYETDMLAGGLSSAILEWCCDHGCMLNIKRMGIADHFVSHGSLLLIKKENKIDINTLFDEISLYLKEKE